MDRFKNDEEIINYIKNSLESLEYIELHLLYKAEQFQGDMKLLFRVRNSIEWIIRMNKVLKFINMSLNGCIKFAEKLHSPIDENEIKNMYSYYLENSAYRVLVLWDLYKQLVNEYYSVGFSRHEEYSIFKLLSKIRREKVWRRKDTQKLYDYLNSDKHLYVRNYLRNKYTHSTDPTSTSVFHDFNKNGFIKPDTENIIPHHPFENIVMVIDDLKMLILLINEVNLKIKNDVYNELIIVEPTALLRCGKEEKIKPCNIRELLDVKEQIGKIVEDDVCLGCEFIIDYEGQKTCKPKKIRYRRINETEEMIIEILTDKPIL